VSFWYGPNEPFPGPGSGGGGGGSPVTTKDEGSTLTTSTASLNFAGAGVTATTVGNDVTVTIPGGGGGGTAAGTTFTAGHGIVATDVQAALEELSDEAAALPVLAAGTDIQLDTVSGVTTVSVLGTSSQKWGISDYVVLGADDSGRASTTTQTACTGLTGNLSVSAGGLYWFNARIMYTALTTADIKASFKGPTGATWSFTSFGLDPTSVETSAPAQRDYKFLQADQTVLLYQFGGADANIVWFDVEGLITVGGTAGTIDFWYAQNVSQGTATIVKAGSWMKLQRV
jgi:hypothetical protein